MIVLAKGNQRKRVTDIITVNDLESWTAKNIIIISAGTGAGKSYFVKNIVYKYAKSEGKKILFLIHRSNCVTQFKQEIERDDKANTIDIMTYQRIENDILQSDKHINFEQYAYIVCDEFHYFIADATFNHTTDISFAEILKANNCIKIYMSATGEDVEKYFDSYLSNKQKKMMRKYELPPDYSYVENLTFFSQYDDISYLAEKIINENKKAIIFIQSVDKAYKLYKKYSQYSLFNCSRYNESYKYVDEEKINTMLKNECFEENLLITTGCFDAGANIVDREVKYIVADIKDIGTLIQCLGRKRIIDSDDTVQFFIKTLTNQQLSGLKRSMCKEIEMAEFLQTHNTQELIQTYPRQIDKSQIIYDDTKSNKQRNMSTKKVNKMMLAKKKSDIELYTQMMKEPYGYCKYLSRYLKIYPYNIFSKDHSLIAFLEDCVKNNSIMLQVKDRKPLIDKLNLKVNRRKVKGMKSINEILKEFNIPYKVVCFETTRHIQDKLGKTVKKKYKAAWRIERVNNDVV